MTDETRVPAELDNQRADLVVARLAEVSRAVAKKAIEAGGVTVDGATCDPATRLHTGQALTIEIVEVVNEVVPEAVEFGVRYESPAVRVIDKPPGVVVHPGAGNATGTLAAGLLERFDDTLGDEHRWGLVHRLDKDTSGLLLVARTPEAHEALTDAMRKREVRRSYLSVVAGTVPSATGTIEAPLGRDPNAPTRIAVQTGGRHAVTHYARAAEWPGFALLDIELETGRTHQIRVHLGAIDLPVVGDGAYGDVSDSANPANPGRVWLHAYRLGFVDPSIGEEVTVLAPLPDDLVASLERLGKPAVGTVPTI
ncbi:MAG: RluA family pseudouridine synthase [Acidimicrobiia bacterium]|nr:RluA family pseudouridine synthase [Acidimicrobiia bacterium]